MKHSLLLPIVILAFQACKPANQSFENWSKDSSSYLLVSMPEQGLGWQYDFWYQGKQLDPGTYSAYIQSLGNNQEAIPSLSMNGTMSSTHPRFAINVYSDKYKCSATHKTLLGVIPLICSDDKIDRLVAEDQGDCKANNSQITLEGKTYEVEFNEKKDVELLINNTQDHFAVFEQMLSLAGSSGSDDLAKSIVDYNVFEDGKLITPSFIVRKEGDRQSLYAIQADEKDDTAPTFLIADIAENSPATHQFPNGTKSYKTTLKKNICVGKLKKGTTYLAGSFLFLPTVFQK